MTGQALRFFLVSVAGLVIDLAVAWTMATLVGLPLWHAGAIGFVSAAAINYVLHERWTFGTGSSRVSALRGVQYLGIAGLALMARTAAILLLETLLGDGRTLAVLVLAAGISFAVSFVASRWLFTRGRRAPAGTPPRA